MDFYSSHKVEVKANCFCWLISWWLCFHCCYFFILFFLFLCFVFPETTYEKHVLCCWSENVTCKLFLIMLRTIQNYEAGLSDVKKHSCVMAFWNINWFYFFRKCSKADHLKNSFHLELHSSSLVIYVMLYGFPKWVPESLGMAHTPYLFPAFFYLQPFLSKDFPSQIWFLCTEENSKHIFTRL